MKSLEVDMSRHSIDELETDEDDQAFGSGYQRSAKRDADQPRRSPIRRKDKLRQEQEDGLKPKAKRNHKKVQHRIKHEWQGE